MFNSSFIEENEQITEEKFSLLNYPNAFYMKIEQVPIFLFDYSKKLTHPFCMITHRGDLPVTSDMFLEAKKNPLLIKWFGQNINCEPDEKLTSIPIGLENDHHYPSVEKRKKIRKASFESMSKIPTKLLYMNFSFWTNQAERYSAYESFVGKSWVTDECLHAMVQENYSHWLSQVLDHHYVLCPRGNGIDTHRLWETLYMGRIPIALNDRNTRYYEDLPILLVDKWSDVTPKLLEENIERFSDTSKFNMDMLKFSWWSSLIEKEITKKGNA